MPIAFLSRSREPDIPLLPLYASRASQPSRPSGHPPISLLASIMSASVPLQAVSRQSTHLQTHLQTLLDAQSEGLLAGLGVHDSADTASSTSTLTPTPSASAYGTSSFAKPPSIVPVRQPKRKKIGLRAARRGISRAIIDLAQLKAEEGQILNAEVSKRDGAIGEVDRLSSKQSDLRTEIEAIAAEPTSTHITDLKSSEKDLGAEIHELETKLFEMKARQRHMLNEISSLENAVQSKLSSYRNALKLAEQEAREYLARPPVELGVSKERTKSDREGVWSLPKERRTLEMVREHFCEEQRVLSGQADGASTEKDALDGGGKVWEDVVMEVDEVEVLLRGEMKRLGSRPGASGAEGGMRTVLTRMGRAERSLEEKLSLAEGKEWKLLIVAIGAELEALVEGQSVLREALNDAGLQVDVGKGKGKARTGSDEASTDSRPDVNGKLLEKSEDEDDGPGPELLISHEEN